MLRAVVFVAIVSLAAASCLDSCRFRFCDRYERMPLTNRTNQIDVALTPAICHDRYPVGIANSGEAYVDMRGSFLPISSFPLNGGRARIARHFFKTFTIRRTQTSGVGHQTLQFEEDVALAGRCVALPITHVQKLEDRRGNVVENLELRNRWRDCVSFRIKGMGRTGTAAWYERGFPDLPDISGFVEMTAEPEIVESAEPMPSAEEELDGAVMF
ncbi:unnamed protein product [Agarophyton chilense]